MIEAKSELYLEKISFRECKHFAVYYIDVNVVSCLLFLIENILENTSGIKSTVDKYAPITKLSGSLKTSMIKRTLCPLYQNELQGKGQVV